LGDAAISISWIAFDPVRNDGVMPGEPLPPTAQLAIVVSYSTGRNHRPIWDTGIPLLISRHAMVRRGGENIRRLRAAMKALGWKERRCFAWGARQWGFVRPVAS
jgi:hypothetical protein